MPRLKFKDILREQLLLEAVDYESMFNGLVNCFDDERRHKELMNNKIDVTIKKYKRLLKNKRSLFGH